MLLSFPFSFYDWWIMKTFPDISKADLLYSSSDVLTFWLPTRVYRSKNAPIIIEPIIYTYWQIYPLQKTSLRSLYRKSGGYH